MLADSWNAADLRQSLVPADRRCQFPAASDRQAWGDLLRHPLRRRQADRVIALAEAEREQPWPSYTAMDCIRYRRDGSRVAMENGYFARRNRLARLAIAEACEGKGRFIEDIVNGLWMICDEASWVVSAHYGMEIGREADEPLPDPDRPCVDLFQAETAHALAEVIALHEIALSAISRTLVRRVRREIHRRVIAPLLVHEYWTWWNGHNNWAPWVASSALHAAVVVCDNDEELCALAHRLMGVCDRFIGHYHADGGCDEGPMYWGVASGALLMFLECLRELTGGTVDIYQQPLIKNMGAYVHRAHLGGKTFMTFADSRAGGGLRTPVVYRYGVRIGDPEMMNLAVLSKYGFTVDGEVQSLLPNAGNAGLMPSLLRELWWMDPTVTPRAPQPKSDTWLDGLQVWVGRDQGLVVAAKAGHNAENHNHNDVGQILIVVDDEPAILDVGCGQYTAKTFSARRYEHWFLSAVGHNVPQVDDFLQQTGKDYAARAVTFTTTEQEQVSTLSADVASCYAAEAGIVSLRRTVTLDRQSHQVLWRDEVKAPGRASLSCRLLTHRVVTEGAGWVDIHCPRSRLRIHYDAAVVTYERDDQIVDEEMLVKAWGSILAGLRFRVAISPQGLASIDLRIERMVD